MIIKKILHTPSAASISSRRSRASIGSDATIFDYTKVSPARMRPITAKKSVSRVTRPESPKSMFVEANKNNKRVIRSGNSTPMELMR